MTGEYSSTRTVRVKVKLRWRPLRIRRWSGRLELRYVHPGSMFETLALEPQRGDFGPATWRAFTRAGVVKKMRRYCERDAHIIEWTEVLT